VQIRHAKTLNSKLNQLKDALDVMNEFAFKRNFQTSASGHVFRVLRNLQGVWFVLHAYCCWTIAHGSSEAICIKS